jgi:hypothetical protein
MQQARKIQLGRSKGAMQIAPGHERSALSLENEAARL